MTDLKALMTDWLDAKEAERKAVATRREIEDVLTALLAVNPAVEGTLNREIEGYKVKIEPRLDRKVDNGKLIDLAAEYGLNAHLGTLFRWSPEVNMTAWRQADDAVTRPLSGAITAKPGRPSYKITPPTQE